MIYEELKRIPYSFFKFMPKGKLQRDDVLINKDGAQTGKVGFYDGAFEEAAVNEHVFILRGRDVRHIDQRYLYYCVLLPETRNQIERRITGSAQPGLNSQFVKSVKIPQRSILKQRKIAAILAGIDTAIERTEALITKYQQIKAGLMHDLFTRGVLPNCQLRPPCEQAPELYHETTIGLIPNEWAPERLENLTSQIVDGVHHTPVYIEHGVPFVTVKNLTAGDGIDFSDLNYVSEADHEEFKRRAAPQAGDVLVTKDGTLGVARVVEACLPDFSIFVSVALLRPLEKKIDVRWLFLFFDAGIFEKQLGFLSAGTGLKHIHLEHFRRFILPIPELDEQSRICDYIGKFSKIIASEMQVSDKLKQQKFGLMQDLLSGKVPVIVGDGEAVGG
jgi:type I restriction enzyme S subunit